AGAGRAAQAPAGACGRAAQDVHGGAEAPAGDAHARSVRLATASRRAGPANVVRAASERLEPAGDSAGPTVERCEPGTAIEKRRQQPAELAQPAESAKSA